MTSPVITTLGANSSKTAGTSLVSTQGTSRTWAAGDVLVAHLAMDPTAGTVSFTAVTNFSAWSANLDAVQGSGTSGVRTVAAWCQCTTGFTGGQSVTANFPSTTAKTIQTYFVTGCDSTTPVRGTNTNASASSIPVTVTVTSGGSFDGLTLALWGYETTTGASTSYTLSGSPAGWTSSAASTASSGTTGSGAASNISAGYQASVKNSVSASDTSSVTNSTPSASMAVAALMFASPLAVTAFAGSATATGTALIPDAPPRIHLIQSKTGTGLVGTSVTLTLPSGVTQGNLLIFQVVARAAGLTFTPPAGWSAAGSAQSTTGTPATTSQMFYLLAGAADAGTTSFTVSWGASWNNSAILTEWNCLDGWQSSPLDQQAGNTTGATTSTTMSSGTTPATSQSTELAVASLAWYNSPVVTESAPTAGWTTGLSAITSGGQGIRQLYQITAATGTQQCQETLSSAAANTGSVATFMVSSAQAVTALAGLATAPATAPDETPAVAANAGLAAASASAPAPSVLAGTVVLPGAASASAAAPGAPAGTVIITQGGLAAAAGSAPAPQAGLTVPAGLPAVTGTAPVPQAVTTVLPGLATATATAPAPSVSASSGGATSPALTISGFGLTDAAPSDEIDAVLATVNCWTTDAGMGPLTYELRDGSGTLIGTAAGTASTSAAHYDSLVFPAPSWSQMSGLQLVIRAAQGTAASGSVASVDYAALAVSYVPAGVPSAVAQPGVATAAGTAPPPAAVITFNAGLATAAGTAPAPVAQPAVTATAGLAAAAGTAPAPAALNAVTAAAGLAAAAASAPAASVQTSAQTTVTAGLATAAASAPAPSIQTSAAGTGPAGLAASAGTAPGPKAVITANAGLAAATGTAPAPGPQVTPGTALAAATGTALVPALVIVTRPAQASAAGTAPAPVIVTSALGTGPAGLAAATGTAPAPSVKAAVTSGPFSPGNATVLTGGTGTWVSPGNALADDGLVATWTVP